MNWVRKRRAPRKNNDSGGVETQDLASLLRQSIFHFPLEFLTSAIGNVHALQRFIYAQAGEVAQFHDQALTRVFFSQGVQRVIEGDQLGIGWGSESERVLTFWQRDLCLSGADINEQTRFGSPLQL